MERKKWVHYDVRAIWYRDICLMLTQMQGFFFCYSSIT